MPSGILMNMLYWDVSRTYGLYHGVKINSLIILACSINTLYAQ